MLISRLAGRLKLLVVPRDHGLELVPAESELLWNLLIEVALNTDPHQRATLRAELGAGLDAAAAQSDQVPPEVQVLREALKA